MMADGQGNVRAFPYTSWGRYDGVYFSRNGPKMTLFLRRKQKLDRRQNDRRDESKRSLDLQEESNPFLRLVAS